MPVESLPDAAITFHLAPAEVWRAQADRPTYLPESYEADGFIHCTDGEEELIAVGNRYYTSDPRAYVVLSIDRDGIAAPVRYEDPGRIFPHIYGPLNTDAVLAVRRIERAPDGAFVAIAGAESTPRN
jgi:uncharacterized protein (DUF952 family)